MNNRYKKYLTEYELQNIKYSFYCIASSEDEANQIIKERNLNEMIIGVSDIEIDKKLLASLIHEVCFLSYIAMKSGKANIDEILSDKGVLHESIHLLDDTFNADTINNLEQKVMWLRNVTNTLPSVSVTSCIINAI